ncbi:MAG TPA: type II toxin-antitoxin system PemK/MazF family toxin [Usitatibacter sp.]|nr:type II toxin-antitoxin system PemK/MazF family toxin [Usitatibacter sp.]
MTRLAEGDLIWVPDEEAHGREQAGKRPAIVVSVDAFNDIGMAMVCPVSSHRGTAHATRNPLEVALPGDLPLGGVVLCDQIRTIDWKARKATRIANAGRPALLEVRARLRRLLGI